jgi:hypothetical protein
MKKNLVTITGAPTHKGEVVKDVAWQLTKAAAVFAFNRALMHVVYRTFTR